MMSIRKVLSTACLLALALGGCATAEPTDEGTTPAAAEGAPTTVEPTTGSEAPVAAPAPAPVAAAPAPATPAATVAAPAAPAVPPVGALITHKVKDYDAWKVVFDGDMAARKQGSALAHGLMRDATNDKLVSIWLPATDAEKLKAFGASKELKDKMKEAGVIGKPEVVFMKPITLQMDPSKTGLSGVMLKASVKDFAAFQTALDQAAPARTAAGIVGYGFGQDLAAANSVYLYLESDDIAKLKAYVDSKDTKKAWKDAGVKGAPKASYVKEIETVMYTN